MRSFLPVFLMAAADGNLQESGGSLGKLGTYSEEITKDGHMQGALALKGDIVPAIPGAVMVEADIKLKVDPVAVILFEAEKINNPVAQWIAKELLSLRAGNPPSAEIAAAHAEATKGA